MLQVLVYSGHRVFVRAQFVSVAVDLEVVAYVHHEGWLSGETLVGPEVRATLGSDDILLFYAKISRVNVNAHSVVRFTREALVFAVGLLCEPAFKISSVSKA